MDDRRNASPQLQLPTVDRSTQALDEAHRLFARTLAGWASDVLSARQLGLTEYAWHAEHGEHRWGRAA